MKATMASNAAQDVVKIRTCVSLDIPTFCIFLQHSIWGTLNSNRNEIRQLPKKSLNFDRREAAFLFSGRSFLECLLMALSGLLSDAS